MSENKTPEDVIEVPSNVKVLDNTKTAETQAPKEAEKKAPSKLRVGIVGDNLLGRASDVAFNTKATERLVVSGIEQLDELIGWKPTLAVICMDIPLRKNDSLDDSDFLNIVNTLIKRIDCGICIRSTLNIETIQRLIMSLGMEVFEAKVTYMPDVSDSTSLGDILAPKFSLVGGSEKAVGAFMQLIKHTTHLSTQDLAVGTIFEVAYAKLGISGFKAVKQTYFNQLHDTILDVKNANPTIVRRMMEQAPDLTDTSLMIPTFIRAGVDPDVTYKQARSFGGEYLNRDVRMLVGMTDKIPLVDECVNYKNLEED